MSVCSGIEAATVAWHDLGFNPVGFSEIEKFPSELLEHHYPNVTNFGDMTKFKEWNIHEPVNILVGGTPCQSFSTAGLRKGLEDPRGNLMLTYLAMAGHFKPKWLLWENVSGVLSSNRGGDFATLLQWLAELGYGFAYRVLDAQHFGVPQRRRRVFVVGCFGDWRSAAKVLFESESLCRDITKGRSKGQETSYALVPSIANCLQTTCHEWSRADGFNMITESVGAIMSNTLTRAGVGTYAVDVCNQSIDGDVAATLTEACGGNVPIAHAFKVRGGCSGGGKGYLGSDNLAFTLSTTQDQQIAVTAPTLTTNDPSRSPQASEVTNQIAAVFEASMRFRRLTPKECERLQGFPDDYTNIPSAADSNRYKALGNSMAVPVMRWIGNRIQGVENGMV